MVIITTIQSVLKYLEKLRQKCIEASKASIEMAEKSKEEVSANKELCDSYIELFKAYKEGKKTKEDLYDITEQITEAYNLEVVTIAKLTGNYDKLTESIKKQ